MKVRILTSSSAGNCTLFWNKSISFIIDCGCSFSYANRQFKELNMSISSLKGACITHIHRDHINGIFFKKLFEYDIPVYCNQNVIPFLPDLKNNFDTNFIRPFSHITFTLDSVKITPFPVEHDSSGGCCGFCIGFHEKQKFRKITIATDLGNTDNGTLEYFKNSDLIIIESNHDEIMLSNDSIPWFLKRRIHNAHLSNEECANFLSEVIKNSQIKPKSIVLAHISQHRNKESLIKQQIADEFKRIGYEDIQIFLAQKNRASDIIEV